MKNEVATPHLPGADIVLPNEIAGLAFAKRINHAKVTEDSSPGWGISLGYENKEGAVADIYEYTEDLTDPTDGIESLDAIEGYFRCVNIMLGSEIDGPWGYVKPHQHRVLQYGSQAFLVASFFLQDDLEDQYDYSVIALTINTQNFLKIRYTLPLPDVPGTGFDIAQVDLKVNDFLKDVALALP